MFTGGDLIDFDIAILKGDFVLKKLAHLYKEVAVFVVGEEHIFWVVFAIALRETLEGEIEKVVHGSFGLPVFPDKETAHENHFDPSIPVGGRN